jgi:UDP-N-acetylmuramyl-tripeptide synthetase
MHTGSAPLTSIPHPLALRDRIADATAQWLRERLGPHAHLSADSRRLSAGDGFLARSGARSTAGDHLQAAIARGAAAIAVDAGDDPIESPVEVEAARPMLRVPGLAHRMGMVASAYYGRPSMGLQLVAVTGTNGKSTVTYALARAMARSGFSAAAVGTLGVAMFPAGCAAGDTPQWDTEPTHGLTTPDAVDLQRLLYQLRSASVAVVALEASSIGIAQGRLQGCSVKVAAFTNLSHDHLDVHGSMEAYAGAKSWLFEAPSLAAVVVNTDDPWHSKMWGPVDPHVDRIAVGRHQPANARWGLMADRVDTEPDGLRITLRGTGPAQALCGSFAIPVIGQHNADNAMVMAACMLVMKVEPAAVIQGLAEIALPPGRMEMICRPGAPRVCIDYAHSPEALRRVLEALQLLARRGDGRLFCVFGCGGDRDAEKRPLMGAVASGLADIVTLTSDNPRHESPQRIVDEIVSGISQPPVAGLVVEPDRAKAIASTIGACRPEDVVLIAGKGHERVQEVAGDRLPFSDIDHAYRALDNWQVANMLRMQAGGHHAAA